MMVLLQLTNHITSMDLNCEIPNAFSKLVVTELRLDIYYVQNKNSYHINIIVDPIILSWVETIKINVNCTIVEKALYTDEKKL